MRRAGARARGLLLAAAAIAAIALIGMHWENAFLYFPTRALAAAPADFGLAAENLSLETEDGVRLAGWWIRGEGRRAVLFLHGNAGNAADRLERARELRGRFGLDVFLVDYRGYGASTGSPSENGLLRDARAILAAAAARGFPPERVVVFGESLGSAVAIALTSQTPVGAVILETPFESIRAMARRYYPWIPAFLIRTRFDNAEAISGVRAPKLFLVAERDDVVPTEQSLRLYERAPAPKQLFLIPGARHNDTYAVGGEAYWKAVGDFLAATAPR